MILRCLINMVQELPRFNYLHVASFFPCFVVKMQEGQNRTWPASSRKKKIEYDLLKRLVTHFNLVLAMFNNWDKVCWQSQVGCWEPLRFSGELHVPYVQHYSTLAHAGYYRSEPFQPFNTNWLTESKTSEELYYMLLCEKQEGGGSDSKSQTRWHTHSTQTHTLI